MVSIIAPGLALTLRFIAEGIGPTLVLAVFVVIVFALGIASMGADLASKNFILDLAPDAKRPVYIGVNDSLVAVPTMLLAGGGLAIDAVGFTPVFVFLGVCGATAALLIIMLREKSA